MCPMKPAKKTETKKEALKRKLCQKALKPHAVFDFQCRRSDLKKERNCLARLLMNTAPESSKILFSYEYDIFSRVVNGIVDLELGFGFQHPVGFFSKKKMQAIKELQEAWEGVIKIEIRKPQHYIFFVAV